MNSDFEVSHTATSCRRFAIARSVGLRLRGLGGTSAGTLNFRTAARSFRTADSLARAAARSNW